MMMPVLQVHVQRQLLHKDMRRSGAAKTGRADEAGGAVFPRPEPWRRGFGGRSPAGPLAASLHLVVGARIDTGTAIAAAHRVNA